ncbi:hypothetical protein DH2020_026887 [Rehmannia glutinosa]|uniref:50S ribosomal protein L32, chloroplastic n=1 Tax=Rehmannia glutinosa TaxID=99300 RepID=A0ABR0VZ80_REHGL
MLRSAGKKADGAVGGIRRLVHALAQPAPLGTAINHLINTSSPPLVFPENHDDKNMGTEFPNFPFFGGAMELMAVPKKKVSRHKRGIRNGPKALKPIPVIIRCRACGRVKLPHFFCCSGIKPNPEENETMAVADRWLEISWLDLKKQKVPEWTEAYVDYNGLKRILQEIQNFKRNKPTSVRASQKRLSLFRDFSASALHDSDLENQEDIENQVIAVHTVQQENSRKLYNTKLLVSPGEGEENERFFFKKLDDELNKTNNFYKDKVEEMIEEATLLNKQMEALIALRIKVIYPDFDGSSSLTCLSTDISDLEPSKIIPPSRTETVGIRQMDGKLGVEMSCRSQLELISSSEVGLSCQVEHSDAKCDIPPMEDSVDSSTSIDGENINERETSHLEILDRVKISNTFDNPMSAIKRVFKDPKEKGLSYNKEELKAVEGRLKVAFIEFYQKLCLLKHYSFLNLSAFSKILKKYEKITSRSVARSYMKIVDNSYIGSSDEHTVVAATDMLLQHEWEIIMSYNSICSAAAEIQLSRPLVTSLMERVEVVFVKNFLNSNRQEGMKLLRPKQKVEKHRVTFFSGFFSGCSIALLVAVVLLIEDRKLIHKKNATLYMDIIFPLYRRYKINYPFIFGFKQGTELGYREVFLLSNGLAVIALATFLVHLHIKMDSKTQHYETYIELLPLGLVIVTLPDFFLADQFTSQLYHTGSASSSVLNRLFEEKDFSHGLNGLRYFWTIVAVVIRTAFELRKEIAWKVLALVSSAIATIANTYWDIVVDWGLLQRKSKNLFLRDKLLVSHKNVYFAAMVLDILLRFAWLQLVLTFDVYSLQGKTISMIFSCLEILRAWLMELLQFGLENEHLNNVGRYRAFKSVPLPFTYYDDEDDDDIDKDD